MALELPRIIQKVTLQADSDSGIGRLKSSLEDLKKPLGDASQGTDNYTKSAKGSRSANDDLTKSLFESTAGFKSADKGVKDFDTSVKRTTGDLKDHNAQHKELHSNLDKLTDRVKIAAGGMSLFSESLKFLKAPAIISAIQPIIQGLNAAAAGAFSFVSAIAPATGILGALPGLLGTVGTGLAVVKLGFGADLQKALKDSSKDLKTFQADLKNLTPPAQQFVKTLVGLKPVFTEMKTGVQTALYEGLTPALLSITKLAPVATTMLRAMAGSIGTLAKEFTSGISGGDTIRKLFSFGQGNASEVARLGPILADVAKAFLNVGLAAQPMVSALTDLVAKGAAFARSATESGLATGKLTDFFLRAVDKGRELGRIISNTVVALVNMGRIANGGLGDGLLSSLEKLTARFRSFTESTSGKASLAKYFSDAEAPLHAMAGLIGDVAKLFSRLGADGTGSFTNLIDRIRTDFLPLLEQIAGAAGPGFLSGLLDLAQTLLQIFAQLAGSSGPMILFLQIMNEVATVLNAVIRDIPGIKELVFALGAVAALNKALNVTGWITGLSSFGRALGDTEKSATKFSSTLSKVASSAFNSVWLKFSSSARESAALVTAAAEKEAVAVAAAKEAEASAVALAASGIKASETELALLRANAAVKAEASAENIAAAYALEAEAAESSANIQIQSTETAILAQKAQMAQYEANQASSAAAAAQSGSRLAGAIGAISPVLQGVTLALGIGAVAWSLWSSRTQRAKEATDAFKKTLDITKPFMDSITDATQKFLDKMNQSDDIGRIDAQLKGYNITLADFARVAAGSELAAQKIRQALVDVGSSTPGTGITLKRQLQPTAAQKINFQKGDLVDITPEERDNVIKYGEAWAKANGIIISGNTGVLDSLRALAKAGADSVKQQVDDLANQGKITAAQRDQIELEHIHDGMLQDSVGITKEVANAISATARAQEIANRTVEDAINAQTRLNDLKRGYEGSVREATRASLDENEAQKNLFFAQVNLNKVQSPENVEAVTKAQLDLADAHDRTTEAAQAAADKYVESQASAREAGNETLTQDQKDRLAIEDRIKAYDSMRAFTAPGSPLRIALDGLIGDLQKNLDSHDYNSTVNVAGVDVSQASLDSLTGDLNRYDDSSYTATLGLDISAFQKSAATALGFLQSISNGKTVASLPPARNLDGSLQKKAAGGPVQANVTYLVGEEGPELFTAGAGGTITDAAKTKNFLSQLSGVAGSPFTAAAAVAATGQAFSKTAAQVADAYAAVLAQISAERSYTQQSKTTADAINSVGEAFTNIGTSKGLAAGADEAVKKLQTLAESTAAQAAVLAAEADAAEARASAAHVNADNAAASIPTTVTASGQRAATRAANQAAVDAAAADDAAKTARQASDDAATAASKAVDDLTNAQNDAAQKAKDAAQAQIDYEKSVSDATGSILDQADAAVTMAEKNKELAGGELTNVEKITLHIQKLDELTATLAPDSPLRTNIKGYVDELTQALPAAAAADAASAANDAEKAASDKYQQTLDQIDATDALTEAEKTSAAANDALNKAAAAVFLTSKNPKATAEEKKQAEDAYQQAIKDSTSAVKSGGQAAIDAAEKQAALQDQTLSTADKIKIQTDEMKKLTGSITNKGVLDAVNSLIDRLAAIVDKTITVTVNTVENGAATGSTSRSNADASTDAVNPQRLALFAQASQKQAQIDALKASIPAGQVDLGKLIKAQALQQQIQDLQAQAGKLATGGNVDAGRPYIVGDAGRPELFIPKVSGYMLPSVPNVNGAGGKGYQQWSPSAQQGPREAVHIDHAEFHDGADIDLLQTRAEFQLRSRMP